MSIIFCPRFWGRKWPRQFYGRLGFFGSFCWKSPVPIKFLLLGEGEVLGFFRRGGVEVPIFFFFMGAGIFLNMSLRVPQKECGKRSSITFFRFRDAFGHFSVTFSDAFVTFSSLFCQTKLLLPDSFCGRVRAVLLGVGVVFKLTSKDCVGRILWRHHSYHSDFGTFVSASCWSN